MASSNDAFLEHEAPRNGGGLELLAIDNSAGRPLRYRYCQYSLYLTFILSETQGGRL